MKKRTIRDKQKIALQVINITVEKLTNKKMTRKAVFTQPVKDGVIHIFLVF